MAQREIKDHYDIKCECGGHVILRYIVMDPTTLDVNRYKNDPEPPTRSDIVMYEGKCQECKILFSLELQSLNLME